jgi:glycosyltransferase involved in cell wall biosynthesis
METNFPISVIIPTYNGAASLQVTLRSLAGQTLATNDYEVIVVDDESVDHSTEMLQQQYPFKLTSIKQIHQGATLARNLGARHSRGALMIFVDDDIELAPRVLEIFVEAHKVYHRAIIVGALIPAQRSKPNVDQISMLSQRLEPACMPISFTICLSGLISVKSDDFYSLGMFQDPTGGWPNWDDIDFGYRAQRAGFKLLRNSTAIGIHHDASAENIEHQALRSYNASVSAVRLFQKYPEIQPCFPMFRDKTPIDWRRNEPMLVLRKLSRRLSSLRPILWIMMQLAKTLETLHAPSILRRPLQRWVVGAFMCRGFQRGLEQYRDA